MPKSPRSSNPRRFPLPLSTSGVNILPDTTVAVTSYPQMRDFYPERLLIKEAHQWQIKEISAGGRVLARDLPGGFFAPEAPGFFPGRGEVRGSPLEELTVEATYKGPLEAGIPFEACVFGSEERLSRGQQALGSSSKLATAYATVRVSTHEHARATIDPMKQDVWPRCLVIKEAADWIVADILINGRSFFAQSGDVPGSMFAENEKMERRWGCLKAGQLLTVMAKYIGSQPQARLEYELYGTLEKDESADFPVASILPMSSNVASPQSMIITARPQVSGFRADRIIIDGAADWLLNGICIGRASQFAQQGDVPALAFKQGAVGNGVSFDLAEAGMDVQFTATYVGSLEAGALFSCGIWGSLEV